MKIKVCGMREPQNIRDVEALGVDMIGLIFYPQSKRFVEMNPSLAATIPDYAPKQDNQPVDGVAAEAKHAARVGVFVDDMPQNIVTRVSLYGLDYVQLHGDESPVMIDNLRRTLEPDIRKGVRIIKAISVANAADIRQWRQYRDCVDLLLFDTKGEAKGGNGQRFDWQMLQEYDGNVPFLLSGGIGETDAEEIRNITHPMLAGIDLNSCFELSPGLKDVPKLRRFLDALRA